MNGEKTAKNLLSKELSETTASRDKLMNDLIKVKKVGAVFDAWCDLYYMLVQCIFHKSKEYLNNSLTSDLTLPLFHFTIRADSTVVNTWLSIGSAPLMLYLIFRRRRNLFRMLRVSYQWSIPSKLSYRLWRRNWKKVKLSSSIMRSLLWKRGRKQSRWKLRCM